MCHPLQLCSCREFQLLCNSWGLTCQTRGSGPLHGIPEPSIAPVPQVSPALKPSQRWWQEVNPCICPLRRAPGASADNGESYRPVRSPVTALPLRLGLPWLGCADFQEDFQEVNAPLASSRKSLPPLSGGLKLLGEEATLPSTHGPLQRAQKQEASLLRTATSRHKPTPPSPPSCPLNYCDALEVANIFLLSVICFSICYDAKSANPF